jgi:hypothetical protein
MPNLDSSAFTQIKRRQVASSSSCRLDSTKLRSTFTYGYYYPNVGQQIPCNSTTNVETTHSTAGSVVGSIGMLKFSNHTFSK